MSLYLGENLISGVATPIEGARNIGQIIQSTIPLTDAGLHLLNGALISGSGSYADFVDYIADLYNSDPTANYFAQPLEEQDWVQPTLSANGILGGNSFACESDSNYNDFYAYKALDGNSSTSWQSNGTTTSGTWFKFYNPTPIKVIQITWSGTPTYGTITGGIIYGSNDDLVYTQLGTFSDGTTTGGTIDLSTNTNFYKYYKITPTTWTDTSGTLTNGWAELTITARIQSKTAEQVWQDSVTNYGVCGKFVYDSVNNTVRLPKYSNKIYTSDFANTAGVKGNGIVLGLTNGTDNAGVGCTTASGSSYGLRAIGTLYGEPVSTGNKSGNIAGAFGVTTDATKSGIIADLSNITTALDGYYYIVIATSTKTDIEVDIDEIATDLNSKADVDLTNCTKPHIVDTYENGTDWYRVYSDGWCEQGGYGKASSAGSNYTVNLLKSFTNTNYTVNITNYLDTKPSGDYYSLLVSKAQSSFILIVRPSPFDWVACGYII